MDGGGATWLPAQISNELVGRNGPVKIRAPPEMKVSLRRNHEGKLRWNATVALPWKRFLSVWYIGKVLVSGGKTSPRTGKPVRRR